MGRSPERLPASAEGFLKLLFHHEGKDTPQKRGVDTSTFLTQDADAVVYTNRHGARLFAAGSN